jgi:dTMP kinase
MQKDIISKLEKYNSVTNESYLISFEGIEGSGKSTQIKLLKEHLEQKNYRVLLLREPGGTAFGENLRSAILNSDEKIFPLSEAFLFAASRTQLLNEKVLPFLDQKNSVVILDRYIDSSIAYQGFARELGIQTILDIHSFGKLKIVPQLTLYLKINLETSMARQDSRGNKKDYFEKENQHFYSKLIEGYDTCAEEFKDRIKTIDATKSIENVTNSMIAQIDDLLC